MGVRQPTLQRQTSNRTRPTHLGEAPEIRDKPGKPGKTHITIILDTNVITAHRRRAKAAGTGDQPRSNRTLRKHLQQQTPPLTEARLRQMLREELHAT